MHLRTILIALAMLLCTLPAGAQPATAPATTPAQPGARAVPGAGAPVAVIVLEGVIDDFSQRQLVKRFDEARQLGAEVIVLQLDTPGGLVGAALEITRFLRAQDDLYIVAFIDDMAYSAGSMIAIACDQIVMERGSMLGDCAPIAIGSDGSLQTLGEAERAKAESPILADFHASAVRNGYDPTLVASMVAVGRIVHWVESPEGERRFVDETEYAALVAKGWSPVPGVPNPVDRADTLLTIDSSLAETLGLSRGSYASVGSFIDAQGWVLKATLAPTTEEKFINFLGSDVVRGIAMLIFLTSLYAAFKAPGTGGAEAAALISLAVLLGVPLLTGYAGWAEVVAILLGISLIALEIFVLPGFGVPGIMGIVLLLVGLTMTFVGNEPIEIPGILPSLPGTWEGLKRGVIVILVALVGSLLLWAWISRYIRSMPYFNRLILADTATATSTTATVPTGGAPAGIDWPAVGMTGRAVTDLRPGGQASFYDEATADSRVADVVCDSGFVPAGTGVVVKHIEGNRIVVRPEPTA
jgi:membrane-bound serine protease (ClpP class)